MLQVLHVLILLRLAMEIANILEIMLTQAN